MNIIWGMFGCSLIIIISILMSENKRLINVRTVSIGFFLQVVFGFLVLQWDKGLQAIQFVSQGITNLINFGHAGLSFVFGPLADRDGLSVFAVNVLGMIIFLTVLIALLYYFGIMQYMVKIIGGFISKVMQTSYSESIAAAANIFVGNTQAPLIVKPYIAHMSRSQIFSVMVGGLASVSGAVLMGLAAMGIPIEYLISAAVMSAPAGLMIAKLVIPETEKINDNEWKISDKTSNSEEKTNIIDVIFENSKEGLHYAVNVGLMLIMFIGLIALLNGVIGFGGSLIGLENLSLELIFGYLFAPIAFVIGIPWDEAVMAGNLLAQKFLLNEFVAFANLSLGIENFSERSIAILTFALSGFANFGAVGSIVGMLSRMVPERKLEVQQLAIKALIAATLANLLNGAIVMMLF
ncbi:NupC/NupG family nucleoside CNT transporter [Caldalkalibacillus mannanilyticus]|uniref:NupC/NupG family nucleoside CNT transporter n=1 Tax=Caldalkalibacillus mannanilyticus TaxID=1418 RepID=UPI00046AF90A|nr:nucleoside transporter C-terminal domain-containing protein [Caldalkalibacillus mannanilyticus]